MAIRALLHSSHTLDKTNRASGESKNFDMAAKLWQKQTRKLAEML